MKQRKINAPSEPWLLGFHVVVATTECSRVICSSCSLPMCPGALRQLQKSWRKTWMSPRSSPARACQLPLVGSAFLERSIQGKASWIEGSFTSPVKNDGSGSSPEAPLHPFLAVLPCKASPWLLGQQSPAHLMFDHSSALLPSPRTKRCIPPLAEAGKSSVRLLLTAQPCAELAGDADLLLMLLKTSEIVSRSKLKWGGEMIFGCLFSHCDNLTKPQLHL